MNTEAHEISIKRKVETIRLQKQTIDKLNKLLYDQRIKISNLTIEIDDLKNTYEKPNIIKRIKLFIKVKLDG